MISAAALLLAQEIVTFKYVCYDHAILTECMDHLSQCMENPPDLIIEKYATRSFSNASAVVQNWIQRSRYLKEIVSNIFIKMIIYSWIILSYITIQVTEITICPSPRVSYGFNYGLHLPKWPINTSQRTC